MSSIKGTTESILFSLCKRFLYNPNQLTEKVFEPLQTSLIRNKFQRSYKDAPSIQFNNPSYLRDVKLYWKEKLGIYINPAWHQILASLTDNYDPRYLSTIVWSKYFRKKLNPPVYHQPLIGDKNFLDFYIGKDHQPETVLKSIRGNFFDQNNKLVNQKEAEKIIFSGDSEKFVKPSKLFQGINVCKIHLNRIKIQIGNVDYSFDEFIKKMGKDFIVQNIVEQHRDIAKVHPNSLNTLRIFTVRLGTDVYFINGGIKFGADNNDADNTGNGVLCGIDREKHTLANFAYNRRLEKFSKHLNSGIEFSKFGKIPNYQDAIDLCKEKHRDLLYHDFAAWDVAITKNGNPLIIELNSKPGIFMWQIIFAAPFYGELTETILEYTLKK